MKSAHCVLHSVHQAAERGFGRGAQTYARGRPDYPGELAGWLRDYLHLAPGRTALDLGAGTGKFLPLLLGSGAQVGAEWFYLAQFSDRFSRAAQIHGAK